MTDGDYDGAVQAEQRALAARKQAEQLAAGASNVPPRKTPEAATAPLPTRR